MSTHAIPVIQIESIAAHPNADALDLVQVEGFTCAVRRGDFREGDLAVYIEPDYVVPAEGPFAFLSRDGKPSRIRAKRLRGVWSMGLLVPAPAGASVGDDVMEALGIVRYEPTMAVSTSTEAESPHPSLAHVPKYDLENWRRYRHLLEPDERVIATEKIHGANARYAFRGGRMWCGSRTQWKREDERDLWWRALAAAPWIRTWCEAHPTAVLYGEVYGQVQDLRYGTRPGEVRFRAFDVLRSDGTFLDASAFAEALTAEERAPIVYDGPNDPERLEALALGDSQIGPHLAEGIVIKPARERADPRLGRVAMKLVSNRYLERAK